MALTHQERRHLQELAAQLAGDDPDLARQLTSTVPVPNPAPARGRSLILAAVAAALLALVAAVIGLVVPNPLILGTGLALTIGAALTAAAGWWHRRTP